MMNRKLTSVEKKKFEEERARRILMLFFPEKYQESYLSDRPDIVNMKSGIGVEVTDSLSNSIQEKLSNGGSLSGGYGKDLERYDQENSERKGVNAHKRPNGQVLQGFTFWGSTHDLVNAYVKKLESMNKEGFQLFEENNLFIYAWLSEEEIIRDFIAYIQKDTKQESMAGSQMEVDGARQFDLVYVFIDRKLLEIRLKDNQVTEFVMDSEELNRISNEAFEKITGTKHQAFYGDVPSMDVGES